MSHSFPTASESLSASEYGTAEPLSGVVDGAFWVSKMSYRTLQPDSDDPRLEAAYDCWRKVWLEAFVELDGIERLHSDDFTRQDEIAALFYGDTCVALSGCRFVDLSSSMARDDSYFKPWAPAALDALAAHGSRICIANNMTVQREWRGRIGGLSIKRLLVILSIHRFLVSEADALAGTMRNSRGMDRLGYELGFTPLARGAIHHGVEVDLVGYFRRGQARAASEPMAWTSEHRLALDLFHAR